MVIPVPVPYFSWHLLSMSMEGHTLGHFWYSWLSSERAWKVDNKCLKTLRTWKNNTFYLLHSHSEEQLYLYNQGKYHFANIFIFEINTRTHRNIWKLIVTLRRYVALTIWLVVVVAARNYKKNIFKLSIVHCQLPCYEISHTHFNPNTISTLYMGIYA